MPYGPYAAVRTYRYASTRVFYGGLSMQESSDDELQDEMQEGGGRDVLGYGNDYQTDDDEDYDLVFGSTRSASIASLRSGGSFRDTRGEDARWWEVLAGKGCVEALVSSFLLLIDIVVAALMCSCWWMRPSATSLVYGLCACWMLLVRPSASLKPARPGESVPFPRMLLVGMGAAACTIIMQGVIRGHWGHKTPLWASDWLGLKAGSSWNWLDDNKSEVTMITAGLGVSGVWALFGRGGGGSSGSRALGAPARSFRSRSTFVWDSMSLSSSRNIGSRDTLAERRGQLVCLGIADATHLVSLSQLSEMLVEGTRLAQTTAVWMPGLHSWVSLHKLMHGRPQIG
jgi:hypothetical protein|eukprot:COSAG01_NODE_323_length_18848_cov_144.375273_3_plen_342_part_00